MKLPTTATVEPLLVGVAETAHILASSRSEIYQMIARGELDAVKDGARTKITFESIRQRAASRPKAQIRLYIPRTRRAETQP
jgi:excisionase family DNA binding protein